MTEPTHIIRWLPSQETGALFRASDGMMLAEWQQHTVIFGENPMKRESRLFVDTGCAKKYLFTIADKDQRAFDPSSCAAVEEVSLEGSVVLAPGSVEMLTNGGKYPNTLALKGKYKQ